jgi:hypothetical protein
VDKNTEPFKKAIENGCVIWPTSCGCGGKYAWLVPRPLGAYEMYGCICHNPPPNSVFNMGILESNIVLEDVDYTVNRVDAETISLTRRI